MKSTFLCYIYSTDFIICSYQNVDNSVHCGWYSVLRFQALWPWISCVSWRIFRAPFKDKVRKRFAKRTNRLADCCHVTTDEMVSLAISDLCATLQDLTQLAAPWRKSIVRFENIKNTKLSTKDKEDAENCCGGDKVRTVVSRAQLISKEVIILHYRCFIKHSYTLTFYCLMGRISKERMNECRGGAKRKQKQKEKWSRGEYMKVEKKLIGTEWICSSLPLSLKKNKWIIEIEESQLERVNIKPRDSLTPKPNHVTVLHPC